MTASVPIEKAEELFNQLASTDFEDVATARRLSFELRVLNKQEPGMVKTKVALAEALLRSGDRAAAIDQLAAAFSIRNRSEPVVMDRMSTLHTLIGDYDKAAIVAKEMIERHPEIAMNPNYANNLAEIAALSADFALLDRLIQSETRLGRPGKASSLKRHMLAIASAQDWTDFHETIAPLLRDVQTAVTFIDTWHEDGHPLVIVHSFFDPAKADRRELQDRIDTALEKKLEGRADVLVDMGVLVTQAPNTDDTIADSTTANSTSPI